MTYPETPEYLENGTQPDPNRECCGGTQCEPQPTKGNNLASDIIAFTFAFGVSVVVLAAFLQLSLWILNINPW